MTTASDAAAAEARGWARIAAEWRAENHPEAFADLPPLESAVVRFHDPEGDLRKRMERWGYEPGSFDLADLSRFAAGLAQAEADAWAADQPHVATQAFETRRFLVGDRILHWAVPWLDTVGRCYPPQREASAASALWLLELADRMRPAPVLASEEGRFPPGHDAIGPIEAERNLDEVVLSVWSGAVVFRSTLASMSGRFVSSRLDVHDLLGELTFRRDLATLFTVHGMRWQGVASRHPGAAEIWQALAGRAKRTAAAIG
ncbi:MAG TPA: hypothetical protein VLD62_03690 [Acidimicrobiia bacterium]|nr:hypothetical protein [Acidimicrobiia bacterium]